MTRGKFIVIEGTDGSGKTTQMQLLKDRLLLKSVPFMPLKFPRYGKPAAAPVEAYLKGAYGSAEKVGPKRASLLYLIDMYDASFEMDQVRSAGTHIVSDRYWLSNLALQGCQIADDEARAEYEEWMMDHVALYELPEPDIQIVLYVPGEVACRSVENRGGQKDVLEAKNAIIINSAAAYKRLCTERTRCILIPCTDDSGQFFPQQEIHERVWQAVSQVLSG